MPVTILVKFVRVTGKELDEYLYHNDELGCYIWDVIAVDRKEIHNTGNENSQEAFDTRNLSEFNVMSTEQGICLSSTRIDEKSNEISEMQEVMGKLDYRGCVVIADAMNTQKDTVRTIVKKANRDYCLVLKEKHITTYHEVKEQFANEGFLKEIIVADGQYLKKTEKTASETVVREYFITSDITWFEDRNWKSSNPSDMREKQLPENEQKTPSQKNGISCAIAELFAIVVRRHWISYLGRQTQIQRKEWNT